MDTSESVRKPSTTIPLLNNWAEGWTNIEFYYMDKKTYMLQLKENGIVRLSYNVHVNQMTNEVKKKKKAK